MVSAAQGRELGAHVHLQMLEEVVVLKKKKKKGDIRERGVESAAARRTTPYPPRVT